tara:strand:- start:76 stop:864 length:789 start_codon:yes stop_codon:yes gene_type:complete
MEKKYYPQTLVQSLGLVLLSITATTPLLFINRLNLVSEYIFTHIFFITFVFNLLSIFYFKNRKNKDEFNFNFKIGNVVFIFILLIITFQLAINIPLNFILNDYYNENKINVINSFITLIPFIFLSSFFEELIFRGIILKGYLIKYDAKKAILFSSIFFSLLHLNFTQSLGALLFSLLIGYVYYLSKSIGITILLHLTNNIVALTGVYLLNNYGNFKIEKTSDLYGTYSSYLIVISFFLLIYLFYYIIKNKKNITSELKRIDR